MMLKSHKEDLFFSCIGKDVIFVLLLLLNEALYYFLVNCVV
jgi:hypothetical protein